MGEKRNAYVDRLKDQLDQWNASIDKLEKTAKSASSEMEVEFRDRLAKLRAKRDELGDRIGKLQAASEEAWETLKDGVERAQQELKVAMEDARQRVTKETSKAAATETQPN